MRKIVGRQIDDGPREYLTACPVCGELIDMRDLAEAMGHECGHEPRSFEEGPSPAKPKQ